jgi:thymidylate kinase
VNKNIIIAFLGVDGSGKSSIILAISKNLKKKKIDHSLFHLLPNFLSRTKKNAISSPHKQIERSKLFSIIKLIYWLLKFHFFFKINFFNKSQIFIFDRYPHDVLIDPTRYRINRNLKIKKNILKLFPEPDLWIIMTGDSKKIWKRKKEIELKKTIFLNKKYQKFGLKKKNFIFISKLSKYKKILNYLTKSIN